MTGPKYPRTYHVPWSPGATSDDKVQHDLFHFKSGRLVVTEKMDGGNYTMTSETSYSRSPSAGTHLWDSMARAEWARVRHDIPPNWRIVGESMQAYRSVYYDELPGPFLVFAVFNEHGYMLTWDDTVEWSAMLALPTVPVLYRGEDTDRAMRAWETQLHGRESEGFVLRRAGMITPAQFSHRVVKYVRADHVRTDDTWRHRDDFLENGMTDERVSYLESVWSNRLRFGRPMTL